MPVMSASDVPAVYQELGQKFIDVCNAANVEHDVLLSTLLSTYRLVLLQHPCCHLESIGLLAHLQGELAKAQLKQRTSNLVRAAIAEAGASTH